LIKPGRIVGLNCFMGIYMITMHISTIPKMRSIKQLPLSLAALSKMAIFV
jgi:hypothetical protein